MRRKQLMSGRKLFFLIGFMDVSICRTNVRGRARLAQAMGVRTAALLLGSVKPDSPPPSTKTQPGFALVLQIQFTPKICAFVAASSVRPSLTRTHAQLDRNETQRNKISPTRKVFPLPITFKIFGEIFGMHLVSNSEVITFRFTSLQNVVYLK